MSNENKYPEHEKLSEVREVSQALGSIIEWRQMEKNWMIAEYNDEDTLQKIHININPLLAEYYKIDLIKLNDEKEQMLEEIRKANI